MPEMHNTVRSTWYRAGCRIALEVEAKAPLTPEVLDRVRRIILAIESTILELDTPNSNAGALAHRNAVAELERERREQLEREKPAEEPF